MKTRLITEGLYSDYRVLGVVSTPDDLDIALLWTHFYTDLWDHGAEASYTLYAAERGPGFERDDPAWSGYAQRRAAICAWRATQPWGKDAAGHDLESASTCFMRWLVLNHGCQECTYDEVRLVTP